MEHWRAQLSYIFYIREYAILFEKKKNMLFPSRKKDALNPLF